MPSVTLNSWAGATSDLVGVSNFCIISTRRNNNNRRMNFDAAGYQITPGGTTGFVLAHTVSGHRLNIGMVFNDSWGTNHTLSNYSVTGYITPLITGPLNCTEGASSLTLTLPAAELAIAQAGIYQATLGFDALQQNGNYTGVLQFTANIPELIQITRLNDINLIPIAPFADHLGIDDFCIFRNGQGGFSLEISGSNDAGGNFRLQNVSSVPYQVEVGQTGTYYTVSPSTPLTFGSSGFTGISQRDCGGLDNTSLRLTLLNADAQSVPYGVYTDTLVILVSPN